jgi:putative DNA primase/helicase
MAENLVSLEEMERRRQAAGTSPGVEIVRGDSIPPAPIDWILPGWLAAGKLHILAGQAGTGKTSIALSLAAIMSVGGELPGGVRVAPGDTLIWSGEDDAADSIIPRFLANGGDPARLHIVKGARDADGGARPFDPATDMPALLNAASKIVGLRLVILDPVVSAVSGDSNKNAEVRRSLQPVVDLAASLGAVVLGITHYSKGTAGRDPTERVTGSLAFGALPRLVMGTAKGAQDGDPRRLIRTKSNIGPDGGGFEYDLLQVAVDASRGIYGQRVNWGAALEGSARELLADVEGTDQGKEAPERGTAALWLEQLLAQGPVASAEIEKKAKLMGLAWATVRRAQKALGIKPRKSGMAGGWTWQLPSTEAAHEGVEDAHPKEVSTFSADERLRVPANDREEF